MNTKFGIKNRRDLKLRIKKILEIYKDILSLNSNLPRFLCYRLVFTWMWTHLGGRLPGFYQLKLVISLNFVMRPMSVLSLRLCHPDIRDYRKKVTWQTNLNPDYRKTGFDLILNLWYRISPFKKNPKNFLLVKLNFTGKIYSLDYKIIDKKSALLIKIYKFNRVQTKIKNYVLPSFRKQCQIIYRLIMMNWWNFLWP